MDKGFKIAAAAFVITAVASRAVPALAEPERTPVNVTVVHTADLDLASERGKRQLDHRLANAAREVCGTASEVDLEGRNEVRACRADVLAKAKEDGVEVAGRGVPSAIAAGH